MTDFNVVGAGRRKRRLLGQIVPPVLLTAAAMRSRRKSETLKFRCSNLLHLKSDTGSLRRYAELLEAREAEIPVGQNDPVEIGYKKPPLGAREAEGI